MIVPIVLPVVHQISLLHIVAIFLLVECAFACYQIDEILEPLFGFLFEDESHGFAEEKLAGLQLVVGSDHDGSVHVEHQKVEHHYEQDKTNC